MPGFGIDPTIVRAGELRHRIAIVQPVEGSRNAFGEPTTTLQQVAVVWGKIEPISGREMEYAHSFAATVSHRVTIRYLTGLKPSFILSYGNRTFVVNGIVDVDERRIKLVLYCTEVVQ